MMITKRLYVCLMALLVITAGKAQGAFSFKINEVVTDNPDGLVDNYGERSAWIEITNTSWGTVNLRSCYLTNNRAALNPGLSVPERVKLMSKVPTNDERTTLSAKQSVVFFTDGKPHKGTFHLGFTLKAGEPNFIALFDANGNTLLDSVSVPALQPGQSYARNYNEKTDSYSWVVLDAEQVTPAALNMGQAQSKDKIAEFKERDPYGVAMSIMAMSIVFGCLIALYVFFRIFGWAVSRVSKLARVRAIRAIHESAVRAAIMAKDGMETKGVEMEVYLSVIAMALHEYEEDIHDVESNVLTIHPDHSEWNAKDNAMREWPKQI